MKKNLLNISDITKDDFDDIISYADELNIKPENTLKNKNIGLIFEKNSTRTRLSFQVGINQLSGNYIDVRFDELNLNRFESYEDTFQIMSCYLDFLVFRTTDHKKLEIAYKYFKKPIINIGPRQNGRPRSKSVIDIDYNMKEFISSLKKASTAKFKKKVITCKNPYGNRKSSYFIYKKIKNNFK